MLILFQLIDIHCITHKCKLKTKLSKTACSPSNLFWTLPSCHCDFHGNYSLCKYLHLQNSLRHYSITCHHSDPALLVCHCAALLLVSEFVCPEVRLEHRPTQWSHPLHGLTPHSRNDIGTCHQPVLVTRTQSLLSFHLNLLVTIHQ